MIKENHSKLNIYNCFNLTELRGFDNFWSLTPFIRLHPISLVNADAMASFVSFSNFFATRNPIPLSYLPASHSFRYSNNPPPLSFHFLLQIQSHCFIPITLILAFVVPIPGEPMLYSNPITLALKWVTLSQLFPCLPACIYSLPFSTYLSSSSLNLSSCF